MKSILYVGMDVHTTNYTLSCYSIETDSDFAVVEMEPDYRNIITYLDRVKQNYGQDCQFQCGYEAGSLGYSLYHQLTNQGIECVILAPSTMPVNKRGVIKTDKRDAKKIGRCLAYHQYRAVHVPTQEDNAIKEYIRLRDDEQSTLKRIKQRILAYCTRYGESFSETRSYWTLKHLDWLKRLDFSDTVLQETFQEYLILYDQASEKVSRFDRRIEELAHTEVYEKRVRKLSCLIGIREHTAMATMVETGDFHRFPTAQHYAAYLGLVPGENSSGKHIQRKSITKAGNSHIRKLLIESAQCYSRGAIGVKSKTLTRRQEGNDPQVIAYADRANERLRRKFYTLMFRSTRNIAAAAVARELACFIWGLMTDNIA